MKPLHTIPIAERPAHGTLFSKLLFPLLFNLGQIGIHLAQLIALPLLLIPVHGQRLFDDAISWTKDGYGRLLILITVLFAPTSLVFTTDIPNLVERDHGEMIRLNLPDQLILIANHQAYTDWMYTWIIACYAGHASGLIILLKAALKNIPVVGWGMQFFNFIFLKRSWAADQHNLTTALKKLARKPPPLWLLIFPEGTITSDEERAKSRAYADKEGVPDFETVLHPRTTGLRFCIQTLQPELPNLQLLDMTIGYPGVPHGKYPQDWYGLLSIFFRSVPPPSVHFHLQLLSLDTVPSDEEAFKLWLRERWSAKEKRMTAFASEQQFDGEQIVIPVKQLKWSHWIAAFGGGGVGAMLYALCR